MSGDFYGSHTVGILSPFYLFSLNSDKTAQQVSFILSFYWFSEVVKVLP